MKKLNLLYKIRRIKSFNSINIFYFFDIIEKVEKNSNLFPTAC
jgi:hypothetical protein